MKVKGLNGKVYSLEHNPISSGGEGKIYRVISDSSKLVKIYHSGTINANLEKKISYMVLHQPSSSVFTQIAWPIDLAYDDKGKFCGFVMPRLDITNVLSDVYIYPPKYKISYRQKLILAQNICVVIHEIHKAGYVFGDFNPRNIGININNGSVAFLDTDSYHIVLDAAKGKAFRCNVCAAGYAAPELLGKCYDHIARHPSDRNNAYEKTPLDTFTKETDNFALAIHIFKLLNNGFTPFNGVKENATASAASPGTGDQAVWRDNYCFKPGNKPLAVAIPKLEVHPKYIGDLFTRAFIAGRKNPASRPDAEEWYRALGNYEKELTSCKAEKMHMYSKKLHSCPWCEADVRFHNKLNPNNPISVPAMAPTPKSTISKLINAGNSANTNTAAAAGTNQILHIEALKIKERLASALNVVGWLGFIASIIYVCMPFISNGSIHLDESKLYQIDIRKDIIITVCAVALLCLGSHFSNSLHRGLAKGLSGIWGWIFCSSAATVYYTQLGYSAESASQTWKLFGIMIVLYIVAIDGGSKIGEVLFSIENKKNSRIAKVKHKFNFYEIVLLGMMIAACVVCVPLLINLQLFYASIQLYNLIPIAICAAPILFFILFSTNTGFGESTEAWFCAVMSTSFTVLILWLGHLGGAKTVIGWIALVILAVLLAVYLDEEIDSTISRITSEFLIVVFIVGAYIDMQVIDKGVTAVGTGAHWWMIAPALIAMVLAMGITVKEISVH